MSELPVAQADATTRLPERVGTPRLGRVALAAAGLVLTGVAYALGTARGDSPGVVLGTIAADSWAYLLAGAIAWERRPNNRIGGLLTVVGIANLARLVDASALPAGLLAWIGLPTSGACLLWLLLAYPSGRLDSRLYGVAIAVLAGMIAASTALPEVVGPQVQPIATGGLSVIAIFSVALIAHRWLVASRAARRVLIPIVAASLLAGLLISGERLAGLAGISTDFGSPYRWALLLARAAVPVAFLMGILQQQIARGAVANFVVGLDVGRVDHLRDSLAKALGDPTLQVALWSPVDHLYHDDDDRPVELPEDQTDRSVILLERGSAPVGAIIHDPVLGEDPGLVRAVTAAVRMAVDNERLTATVRAQLEDVRASRMRIVEAADAERQRVERNLHDGAQQRLVALSLALRRARAQLPADAGGELEATLGGASEQLASALSELRDLARGIHPAILTEAGLGPALRSLARESPIPVSVTLELDDRLPDPVAAAAYFLAAEALANVAKYSAAASVAMSAVSTVGQLHMEISDDGVGGADPATGSGLRGLADRVAALGGLLEIHSPPGGGTRLVADLPLESAGVA